MKYELIEKGILDAICRKISKLKNEIKYNNTEYDINLILYELKEMHILIESNRTQCNIQSESKN